MLDKIGNYFEKLDEPAMKVIPNLLEVKYKYKIGFDDFKRDMEFLKSTLLSSSQSQTKEMDVENVDEELVEEELESDTFINKN